MVFKEQKKKMGGYNRIVAKYMFFMTFFKKSYLHLEENFVM
jgi:hypothetical protein